jgi:hypothetical protein
MFRRLYLNGARIAISRLARLAVSRSHQRERRTCDSEPPRVGDRDVAVKACACAVAIYEVGARRWR